MPIKQLIENYSKIADENRTKDMKGVHPLIAQAKVEFEYGQKKNSTEPAKEKDSNKT